MSPETTTGVVHDRRSILIYPSLFFLSATGLAVEVSLIRLFSFLFAQSWVYIVISLSVSGIGFGAVIVYYLGRRRALRVLRWTPAIPAVMALALFSVNAFGSALIPSLVATFGIFVALGMTQVHIFRNAGRSISRIYAADLLGAATGSLMVFVLLNVFGTPATILIVVATMGLSIAGALVATGHACRWTVVALAGSVVLAAGGIVPSMSDGLMPTEEWRKELSAMLEEPGAEIIETRWSAFGRVDVVQTENPTFRTMFIDGGAGTKIISMPNGRVTRDIAETLLYQYMGGLPMLAIDSENRHRAAVVGAGGGIDVVTLLIAGFRSIDAIEINPDFIDLVRAQEEYAGPIYRDHERVTVYEAEGRAFLRGTSGDYNAILMSLPIIKSMRNVGNYALTENYLFTQEAFSEYRAALADDGMLVVVAHYRNELLRLLVNTLRSFENDGISPTDATRRIAMIGDPQNPTLIVKNEPFSDSERDVLAAIIETIPTMRDGSYVRDVERPERIGTYAGMASLADGSGSIDAIIAAADEDISAVVDDSPFFYQLTPGLPREVRVVGSAALLLIVVLTLLFLFDSRRDTRGRGWNRQDVARFAAFVLIGVGFITIEIAVLQRFIVYWQHQTLALAVVLATVLTAGGAGSLLASRLAHQRLIVPMVVLAVGATVAATWGLTPILRATESSPGAVKILVTATANLVIFLPLGTVFPTLLARTRPALYPWMMGVNSIATLTGGVASLVLAMQLGYRAVFLFGAGTYVVLVLLVTAVPALVDSTSSQSP